MSHHPSVPFSSPIHQVPILHSGVQQGIISGGLPVRICDTVAIIFLTFLTLKSDVLGFRVVYPSSNMNNSTSSSF